MISKYDVLQVHHSINDTSKPIYFKGDASNFDYGNPDLFIFLVLFFVLIIYIIYGLIKFTSNRIFGLTIKNTQSFKNIFKRYNKSGFNLIIQHSPLYYDFIKDNIPVLKDEIIDFADTNPYEYSLKAINVTKLLIKNINIDFDHPVNDKEKLSAINKIANNDKVRIFLIVNKSIEKFLETGNTKLSSEKDEDEMKLLKSLLTILESMRKMYVHIYPPFARINDKKIQEDMVKELQSDPTKFKNIQIKNYKI